VSNLVIVESPSKASTIKGYLGKGYKVVASKGHVRDLPKSSFGIDIENNFAPKYINIRGKGPLINELKKDAKNADTVYLAADPDREGEAISWHLANVLGLDDKKAKRVTFNEVTKTAVKTAIKNPSKINMDLVDAQQARRILDRIVGYKLSPILWKKIKSGLSAGRVQSVATRIVVERENEIRAFVPEEFWKIEAELGSAKGMLKALFFGNEKGKIDIHDKDNADNIVQTVKNGVFKVKNIKKAVRANNPQPPFITSTLHQEANKRFGFRSEKTAKLAQELYEGISLGEHGTRGLITYMRTDSLRISDTAAEAAKEYIVNKYGSDYYPKTRRIYKSRAGAQDAHEAIRPSDMAFPPQLVKQFLSPEQFKLYKLIWDRFIASQMESALLDTVNIDIENSGYIFRSSGYTVKHPGFMAIYEDTKEEKDENSEKDDEEKETKLPEVSENEILSLEKLSPSQHFTKPPARYTEATLIKVLEEKGIGRPSTYTPTITTIIQRGYVERDGKSLVPSQLGEITTKLMIDNFPDIVDYGFTAGMEEMLDEVENGKKTMLDVLKTFYADFSDELEKAEKSIEKNNYKLSPEETDIICEKCGSRMVVKSGRFGRFAACPNYPACRNTKPIDKNGNLIEKNAENKSESPVPAPDDIKCDLCGGPMVIRRGRYGNFYACANYPDCRGTKPITKDLNIPCPLCGSKILIKHGRKKSVFYSCEKYPECKFSTWDIPQEEKCPDCGGLLLKKKGKDLIYCINEKCSYTKNLGK
jgi:DNA topoisomerase-1